MKIHDDPDKESRSPLIWFEIVANLIVRLCKDTITQDKTITALILTRLFTLEAIS